MNTLPARPSLEHLKKQAKALLRAARDGDRAALARIAAKNPRLHDAQSCIAREYGFPAWADLSLHVEAAALAHASRDTMIRRCLHLAYGGDVTGSYDAARPQLAARLLQQQPDLVDDPAIACAAGHLPTIAAAIAGHTHWRDRPFGPLDLPPLVAVTHSRLGLLPEYLPLLRAAAHALLQAGADPDSRIHNRYPPHSLAAPDPDGPLSALYGAAGVNRDPALTERLLDAGADPNDNESLYHSLENPTLTRLLLQRGARIAGTNALGRSLDMPTPEALELLLAHGADPNERPRGKVDLWGSPLLRAIAVRCTPRHIAALLEAGADPHARTPSGIGAYRLAMQTGAVEAADLLRHAGAAEPLTPAEAFVAACARADAAEAGRLQSQHPDILATLTPDQLRLMPDSAAWGRDDQVRVMVASGWPIAVRGGDWDASALNHAVFRGDPALTAFLLAHGAHWHERQGYGDDVLGTLSWGSINQPTGNFTPDYPACARALLDHGLPKPARDPARPDRLLVDGRSIPFSEDVTDTLLS